MQSAIKTVLTSIQSRIRTARPSSSFRGRRRTAVATKDSWEAKPMPENHSVLDFRHEYTEKQFAKISSGVIPESMDDRWFMYMEDHTLYIHRSWTGFCIFLVEFVKESDKYRAKRAVVNRDPDEYLASSDDDEVNMLASLIRSI